MMEFFSALEALLECETIGNKATAFEALSHAYFNQTVRFTPSPPKQFEYPSYHKICHIIDPKEVHKRNRLSTLEGRQIFIHAIMHIEYSAFDLALDACYRFQNMPKAYYDDWMVVAQEELRHFFMLEKIAKALGTYYGAFPVHNALFEAAQNTPTLLERMAVVPRFMEANGLDANPKLIKKLTPFSNEPIVATMIEALNTILTEEISHVKKGDYWFKYACDQEAVSPHCYFDIIKKHYPRVFPRMHAVNMKARKEAGFSCEELSHITNQECDA